MADDWPQWFGEGRDGIWRESGIVEKFPEGGPEILWRSPVGQGYAGPAVAGGRVYVMDRKMADAANAPGNPFQRGVIPGTERLVCLDAKSGALIWEKSEDVEYTVSYPSGPRTTPTVDGDLVYTLGAEGNLICRETAGGDEVWAVDFKKALGSKTPVWGFAASPLVDGDLLICLAGGEGTTAVAFDKKTGAERWRALTAKEPGYCPPRIIERGGKRLLIIWHPESVNALVPETGELIWSVPWKLRSGLSVPTPQPVGDDRIFFSCFYNGSMMLRTGSGEPEVLWRTARESEKRTEHLNGIINTAVIDGDHLYGACSYGEFRCLELETGARVWESAEPLQLVEKRPKRWGTAFVTPHEERFFMFTEAGDLVIADLSPEGYREISRANVIEPNGADMRQRPIVWSHPAYSGRCCFVRNDSEVVCVSLAE